MRGTTRIRSVRIAERLRPSILRLGRYISKESRLTSSSVLDIQILQAVRDQPDCTVADLASVEQITRAAMSEHVRRLVQLGYVQRAEPKTYKPGCPVELRLTRTGRTYLNSISKRRSDWLTKRLEELSAAELADLQHATRSLQLILASAGVT